MGHRALIAYERRPGEYELHYSQWGATDHRLLRTITPDTPYADGDVDRDVWQGEHAASLDEIINEHLQYGTWEAFYIVRDDWSVEPFQLVEYTQGRGACIPVRVWNDDGTPRAAGTGRNHGWVEGLRDASEEFHTDTDARVEWLHGKVRSRFNGVQGRAGQYDGAVLSTEDSIPPQYQASTQSLSELVPDGGRCNSSLDEFGGDR